MTDIKDPIQSDEPWQRTNVRLACLAEAMSQLPAARTADEVLDVLRIAAKQLVDADGVSLVMREGEQRSYAADSTGGLIWRADRFALTSWISHWAMDHRCPTTVTDVSKDERIAPRLYASSPIQSLVTIPVGTPEPIAAVTAYWTQTRIPTEDDIATLETLARGAGSALRAVQLLAAMREKEARLSSIFSKAAVGISEISLQGKFMLVNDALCETMGRSREQLLRLGVQDVTHPQDLPRSVEALEHLIATGERCSLDKRYVRPDGTVVFCNSILSRLLDEHDNPRSILAVTVDLSERKRAEGALRFSEQQLRFALDSARMGTWTWDPVEDVALLDARALEIYQETQPGHYSVAETPRQRVHPDDLQAWYQAFNGALDPDGSGHFEVEYRWLHLDGRQIWVQQSGQAHFEIRHGERVATRMTGTVLDITERKAAEERQSLLMREVDHRAKNMLATIQAMVSLSARSHGDLSDFVSAVKHRIASLANAHDLMTVTHWEGARLRTLLDDELDPYLTRRGNISIVDVGELVLKPMAVTAVSMVIHELVTNAAKYGALSVPEGQVVVTCRRNENREVVLEWKERGGPAVEPPQRTGFGSLLISRSLEIEIGGRAELHFEPDGVRCIVHLPENQIAVAYRSEPQSEGKSRSGEGRSASPQRRVLLVEDQAMIALEMSATLQSLGYEVVGPATTLTEATELAQSGEFDAAILDIRLGDAEVFPAADMLAARKIPFAFATAYGSNALPQRYRGHLILSKPLNRDLMRQVLRTRLH